MNKKKLHRRDFISNTGKAAMALTIAPIVLEACSSSKKSTTHTSNTTVWEPNFNQTPLAFKYNELEPNIDAATMEIHYSKHAAAYCANMNEAIKTEYKKASMAYIPNILSEMSTYSLKLRNNLGGHYNHELFWQCLTPKSTGKPSGKLTEAITNNFGSFENFKTQFTEVAKSRFGSGWVWLIKTNDGSLKVSSTANQDNPLMDIADVRGLPLLGLDVWEHAYYLKYQNKRAEYINNFWNILNWNFVESRFI